MTLSVLSEEVYIYPLSFAQERLWFLQQMEPDSASYNITSALRLQGDLDVEALRQSIKAIQERHEVLRTTIEVVDDIAVQVISPEVNLGVPLTDLSTLAPAEAWAEMRRRAMEEKTTGFELSQENLVRIQLLRLNSSDHVLLLTLHHVISDAWSIGVIVQEISALYSAYRQRKVPALPELTIQYGDFADWQREWLAGPTLDNLLNYWTAQLADAETLLELPTDHPRPAVQTGKGHTITFTLDAELTGQLKQLAQQQETTLFMLLLAAFGTLLYRYSGQKDMVIGSPIANRTREEFEQLVGFFVNTLALRLQVEENLTFQELLRRVRQMTLDAYMHQDLPFSQVVEALNLERSLSYSPLVQVMFVLQNAPTGNLNLPGLNLSSLQFEETTAKFDLSLTMQETPEGLEGTWEYNIDLFETDTMRRMVEHFSVLLESIVANPHESVSHLPLLTPAERQQLLVDWNNTTVAYPQEQCVHQLIEAQVERTPDKLAIEFEQEHLTYAELNDQANRLAHYLLALGVGPDVLVGICVERSLEMMVGILGILKAGGAYVPLDPKYPKERIAYILADAAVPVLITQQALAANLPEHQAKVVCLDLDEDLDAIASKSCHNPTSGVEPEHLAYVMYTSGSTGQPKGVMTPHGALVAISQALRAEYSINADDRILQFASISFDASAEEIYTGLSCGATLMLRTDEFLTSGPGLMQACRKWQLSVLDLPTAYWHQLVDELSLAAWDLPESLRLVILGGEKVRLEHARLWHKAVSARWSQHGLIPPVLVNNYGPTEVTIVATSCFLSPPASNTSSASEISIGKPIRNVHVYLLDAQLQPVPIGIPGEIHVGGAGLARGYLNRPDITAERFIDNPFGPGRLYKTGDLARYLPDGNLEFLGRIDHQVKIRGFRIELGEVETALSTHPQVQQGIAIVREDVPGNKQLVAYIVGSGSLLNSVELRDFLKTQLPDFMVPAAFVQLEALPLTPNGKVDQHALPMPSITAENNADLVPPSNSTEQSIADIFAAVLGLESIGIHHNFFELGGNSLLATKVISRLREAFQLEIPLRTLFEVPTVARLSLLIQEVLTEELEETIPAIVPIPRNPNTPLPLSWAQDRLWFLHQLEGPSTTYNMSSAFRIQGPLDVDALKQAFEEITQRHEILRTRFQAVEGQSPGQIILPSVPIRFQFVDLQTFADDEQEEQLQRQIAEENQTPFDFSDPPLLRLRLLKLSPETHLLLLIRHHIVSDAWSDDLIVKEFTTLYQAFSQGQPSPLSPLTIQYADFAQWQRQWLRGEVLDQQLAYWLDYLAGVQPLLELPTDHHRPAMQTYQGRTHQFTLEQTLVQPLAQFTELTGTTPFMVLVATFSLLLHRYSGQDDIVVGTPIANRNRTEVEQLIGFFVNTIVLRAQFSPHLSFLDLLEQIRQGALGGYEHQDIPFEQVVEALQPERNLSYSPLFQVMFDWESATNNTSTDVLGLTITSVFTDDVTAKFDLTLTMVERAEGIIGVWEYNTDLFEEATIVRLTQHLENLLTGILANPDTQVSQLPLLSDAERQQLDAWNNTTLAYPQTDCIHQLFEQQVESTPKAVALVSGEVSLTYQQLNERANQLARTLQAIGVGPDTMVGICLERSHHLLISLLAVLKAGGAYLPLESSYPQERIAYMLQDAGVTVLISQRSCLDALPEFETHPKTHLLCLDDDQSFLEQPFTNLPLFTAANNLAYVIYTSGSTGKPKGVAVAHRSLVNAYFAWEDAYQLRERTSSHLQMASFSFDVFTGDWARALCSGAKLVLCPREVLLESEQLYQLICQQGVDCAEFVPAVFRELVTYLESTAQTLACMNVLVVASDFWLMGEYQRFLQICGTQTRLINSYGVTEATIDSCYFEAPDDATMAWPQDMAVPIGRPFGNVQLHVLDKQSQPVPLGVVGELHIGGAGLAHGYLHRDDLTAERFIPNPFGEGRLYKTGDLACYRADGNVEFLGRSDHQVKIRGFRIELGELEAVLLSHSQVSGAIVVDREDQPGAKYLAAYVVTTDSALSARELRQFLKQTLPAHMVPSVFTFLEKLPLTPNGKVDRRALPAPTVDVNQTADIVIPRTPIEQAIADSFATVLGKDTQAPLVSVYDNFFELGGHSLLATQVVSRLRQTFQTQIPLRALFEAPTPAELATLIHGTLTGEQEQVAPSIVPIPYRSGEPLPLSWAQERLWFLDQLEGPNSTYNMPLAIQLQGSLDTTSLEQALNELVQRHDVLRTCFQNHGGTPMQWIQPEVSLTLELVDLQMLETSEQTRCIQQHLAENAHTPFDLAKAPLLRASLLRIAAEDHILLTTMHHIVADEWSMGIMIQELTALYSAFNQGQSSPLPALSLQYRDFSHWQRQWLKGDVLQQQLDYWKDYLTGAPSLLELPTDYPRPAQQTYRGQQQTFVLPSELRPQLKQLAQTTGTTLFMVLFAAFSLLLHRYSGQDDIVVGTPIANRNRAEIEGLIGFFVNTLALRSQLTDSLTFTDLLEQVRQSALGGYSHQDVPFEQVVEAVQPDRNLSHSPLFQVMFDWHSSSNAALELPGLTMTTLEPETVTAMFDLTLTMTETEAGIEGIWEYSTDLFKPETIERLTRHFQTLLTGILAQPQAQVTQLPLLSQAEMQQALVEWNDTHVAYPQNLCIHQLFEQQVEHQPEAIAVVFNDETLTYRELNDRANQLAHTLQFLRVGNDTLVGIYLERSPALLVSILAILKVGGAYLPLDVRYPQERIAYMLQDAAVPILITQQSCLDLLPHHDAQVICLDANQDVDASQDIGAHEPPENSVSPVTQDSRAYVIYTSGSTGQPKGVAVAHRSLVNAYFAWEDAYQLKQRTSSHLQMASFSFDVFTGDWVRALCSGAKLVLCPREILLDAEQLYSLICREAVDCAEFVPAVFRQLANYLENSQQNLNFMTVLVVGSDFWSMAEYQQFRRICGKQTRLINSYGITEATIDSCYFELQGDENSADVAVPIGRPFANTQLYVLDQEKQPVPVGVTGELYVGGAGLSLGYLNRPQLTTEKFIPNPFGSGNLYCTGDLARYQADGNVEFLGRRDQQVKLRGFRIELGELEATLQKHPQVREAIAIIREDEPNNKRLVAYVVASEEDISSGSLRKFLKEQLPGYMVPNAFVCLEALPLTPNGKINRKALPAPDFQTLSDRLLIPPRNHLELQLSQIWSEVLKVESVGIVDDFFDLGGHSLLAVSLMSRIHEKLGYTLPLVTLFQGATIEQQAILLQQTVHQSNERPAWSPLTPLQPQGTLPPLFLIHPGGGSVLNYQKLVSYLGQDRPIYGLEARGFEPGQLADNSIETMAKDYLQVIKTVQPEGPYHLAGWCLGGTIAWEMAQQLTLAGEQPPRLIFMDVNSLMAVDQIPDATDLLAELVGRHLALPSDELNLLNRHLRTMSWEDQLSYIISEAERRNISVSPGFGVEQLNCIVQVQAGHDQAAQDYVPQPYAGELVLLQAKDGVAAHADEPTLGWHNLAQQVTFDWVPGDHMSMMRAPQYVEVLAQRLQDYLN